MQQYYATLPSHKIDQAIDEGFPETSDRDVKEQHQQRYNGLLRNPALTQSQYLKLPHWKDDHQVISLENPHPQALINILKHENSEESRRYIATEYVKEMELPEVHDFAQHHHDPVVRLAAARWPATHSLLQNDSNVEIREQVAKRAVDPTIITKLAADSESSVVIATTQNRRIPETVMRGLTTHSDQWVRKLAMSQVMRGWRTRRFSPEFHSHVSNRIMDEYWDDPKLSADNALETRNIHHVAAYATHPDLNVRANAVARGVKSINLEVAKGEHDPRILDVIHTISKQDKYESEYRKAVKQNPLGTTENGFFVPISSTLPRFTPEEEQSLHATPAPKVPQKRLFGKLLGGS